MCLHNLYSVQCWCLFLLEIELFSPDSTKYIEWDPAALGEKIKGNWLGFILFQSHDILKTTWSVPLAKSKKFLQPSKLGSPPWLPTCLSWLKLRSLCYFWTALEREWKYYYEIPFLIPWGKGCCFVVRREYWVEVGYYVKMCTDHFGIGEGFEISVWGMENSFIMLV